MFHERDLRRAQDRYAALRREAEVARLVRASRPHKRRMVWHRRLLARCGTLLIAWGWRLRARYGALESFGDERPGHQI